GGGLGGGVTTDKRGVGGPPAGTGRGLFFFGKRLDEPDGWVAVRVARDPCPRGAACCGQSRADGDGGHQHGDGRAARRGAARRRGARWDALFYRRGGGRGGAFPGGGGRPRGPRGRGPGGGGGGGRRRGRGGRGGCAGAV